MPKTITYSSNNSGGSWWLDDDDWKKLEAAGWTVKWFANDPGYRTDRWLDALASSATRDGLSMEDAIAEWESIIGQDSNVEGCPCCGQPHNFYDWD